MFIANPKSKLESIVSNFDKIQFPVSTETIGINHSLNYIDILFDFPSFKTDINFYLDTSPEMDENTRDDIIEQGESYCYSCPYFYENTSNIFYDNYYYEEIESILEETEDLIEFSNKLSKVFSNTLFKELVVDINYDSNSLPILEIEEEITTANELKFVFLEYRQIIKELVSDINYVNNSFPALEIKEGITTADALKFVFLEYEKIVKETIININNSIEKLLNYSSIDIELYNQEDITYFQYYFEEVDKLEEFTYSSPIIILFTSFIEIFKELLYQHYSTLIDHLDTFINSIYEEEPCMGLRELNTLDDCQNYSIRHMPSELSDAYEVYNGANLYEDSTTINDTFTIEIPNTYYKISISNVRKVNIYGLICPSATNAENLEFYPILFPNVYASGEICFGYSYSSDVNSLINKGKFTHVIESFWSSRFNHDLADVGFYYLDNSLYTEEYHEELREELIDIYSSSSIDDDDDDSRNYLNFKNISSSKTSEWEWFDSTNYSLYMLNKDRSVVLLIINEIEQVIHKVIRIRTDD